MPNKRELILFSAYLRVREREYIITIKGQNQVHERKKLLFLLQARLQEAILTFLCKKKKMVQSPLTSSHLTQEIYNENDYVQVIDILTRSCFALYVDL